MMNSKNTISDLVETLTTRQYVSIIVLMVTTAVLGVFLPGIHTESIPTGYIAGELSDVDFSAPKDYSIIDKEATAEAKQNAKREVNPIFVYLDSGTRGQKKQLSELISYLYAGGAEDSSDELSKLAEEFSAKEPGEMTYIEEIASEAFYVLLEDERIFSTQAVSAIRAEGKTSIDIISASGTGMIQRDVTDFVTPETVEDWTQEWIAVYFPDLSTGDANLIARILPKVASENVIYDPAMTKAAEDKAMNNVQDVFIEVNKGEHILHKDSVITEREIMILQEMKKAEGVSISWREIMGKLVLTLCIVVVFLLFLCSSIRYSYRYFIYICIILSGLIITELLIFLVSWKFSNTDATSALQSLISARYTDPCLPVIFVSVMAMFITGRRRIGLATGLVLASLVTMYPYSKSFSGFYIVLITVASIFTRRQGNQRIDLILHALMATGAVAVITLFLSIFNEMSASIVFESVLISAMNCVISFVLVMVFLPVLERVFNIPTTYRLYELAHADSPSLIRLSAVAPGTFNHSKNVSDMAYYACKEIGANAELARVAGLYHDIGKAEHPEYFIENQNGKNVHDDLNKTLSAAVIKSHVRLGVEKAKEAGLPQEVIDIIAEHHGNDIIKYFYNAAVREGKEKNLTVSEEDFRYNGTIPQTPESGVVMLADCAEAATRSLKNPNHQKYEKFINSIIMDKINYKQLTSSQLTMNDLNLIKEAFVRYLMGRDHHRIEYTKD